jgi:TetR/AcrR family transcriptional regulator
LSDSEDHVPALDELTAKDKILIAAREEFVERGFEGARVQQIAAQSGVNKALIYYYFGGKRELYFRVFGSIASAAIRSLAGIVAADMPPEEKLKTVARFYVGFYMRNHEFLRLLMRELANRGSMLDEFIEELSTTAKRSGFPGLLLEMVSQGVAAGRFREQDPRQTVMSLISMSAGYFMLQPVANMFMDLDTEQKQQEFIEARADAVAELLVGGIMAGGK